MSLLEAHLSRSHLPSVLLSRWRSAWPRCMRSMAPPANAAHNGTPVEDAELSPGDRIQLGRQTILKLDYQGKYEQEFHSHLYEAGTRDPLTGVYNRRFLEQLLETDQRLAVRHKVDLCLLMIDLDHFKQVNDQHGHLAGDCVLRHVASTMQKRLRSEDVMARYGGEEFAVLLMHTNLEGARTLANELRERVEQTTATFNKEVSIKVTISIGVAATKGAIPYATERDLLEAADRALYRAKEQGRNRVEVAPSEKDG